MKEFVYLVGCLAFFLTKDVFVGKKTYRKLRFFRCCGEWIVSCLVLLWHNYLSWVLFLKWCCSLNNGLFFPCLQCIFALNRSANYVHGFHVCLLVCGIGHFLAFEWLIQKPFPRCILGLGEVLIAQVLCLSKFKYSVAM